MKKELNIDHTGIVLRSLEDAIPCWEQVFGYVPSTEKIENSRQ